MLFIAAVTCTASQVQAADVPYAMTLNVSAGGFKFSGQDDLRDQPVYDIRLGYDIIGTSLADSIGIEGGVSYVSTFSNTDNTPVNAYLMRLDATYPFTPRKRIVPFLAVGAGAMVIDRNKSTESSPLLAYGGGVKYFVQEFVAMRLDVRQNILFDVGSRNEFQYMFGLSFLLDRDKKIRRLPLPPPPPSEKKGGATQAVPTIDYDKLDDPSVTKPEPEKAPEKAPEKPAEPAPEPEASVPVPLPVAVVAAPVAAVAGLLNQPQQAEVQPEQKAPQKVAVAEPAPPPRPEPVRVEPPPKRAVPVPPVKEKPVKIEIVNPPAEPVPAPPEEEVESLLCPLDPPAGKKPRVLANPSATVLFDSGSAQVKPQALPEIARIAAYLKKNPNSRVHIEGHTDRVGRPDPNMELSKQRVESVKRSLAQKTGTVQIKVTEKAFGCRLPIQTNRTVKGRAQNRRATIEVTRP